MIVYYIKQRYKSRFDHGLYRRFSLLYIPDASTFDACRTGFPRDIAVHLIRQDIRPPNPPACTEQIAQCASSERERFSLSVH